MSKIIRAINAMIAGASRITEVRQNGHEIFFLYNGQYKWSVIKNPREEGEYSLHYYPGEESLDYLAQVEGPEWEGVNFVTYSTKELKTREAKESLAELYLLVKEKVYGVDAALDDIIESSSDDF